MFQNLKHNWPCHDMCNGYFVNIYTESTWADFIGVLCCKFATLEVVASPWMFCRMSWCLNGVFYIQNKCCIKPSGINIMKDKWTKLDPQQVKVKQKSRLVFSHSVPFFWRTVETDHFPNVIGATCQLLTDTVTASIGKERRVMTWNTSPFSSLFPWVLKTNPFHIRHTLLD